MSYVDVNGVRLYYTDQGKGSETVVFSHGFLMNQAMFDHQIKALAENYRVIAFDHRCHGQSQVVSSPFGMYDLVDDAAALIRKLDLGPVHFAGMSTGGFVALRLALRHPELVRSLMLIDTAAGAEDPTKIKSYQLLMTASRFLGLKPLTGKILTKLMAAKFLNDKARKSELGYWKTAIGKLNTAGIRAFGQAIFSRDDVLDALRKRSDLPPALIIVGAEDIATPLAKARHIHSVIPHAEMTIIPYAGHTSPVEEPQAVTARLVQFLSSVPRP
jgi:3-oxoadipate enol-lactonase